MAQYATFDQALDNVELGVSGITTYGKADPEALMRQGLVYELCEWTDRDGNGYHCWVIRYPDDTWDYINEKDVNNGL